MRAGIIRLTYGNLNGSTFTPTTDSAFPVVNYTINQRKLFKVVYDANNNNTLESSERIYYMEYEEEYLHNFDADDNYQSTEFGGMQWGLNGVQLSHTNDALYFDTSFSLLSTIINYIKNNVGLKPKYDFYVTSHDTNDKSGVSDQVTKYSYNGYNFTNNIVSYVNQGAGGTADADDYITTLTLNQQPKSAIEYCYNRNKRDNNGNVTNVVWYLPAVDEIEEIVTSKYLDPDNAVKPTYARFLEFQQQFYWASQPAYIRNRARFDGMVSQSNGAYFFDDTSRARSTSVIYDGASYNPELSGVTGWYQGYLVENDGIFSYKGSPVVTGTLGGQTLNSMTHQPGNRFRTSKARVRCVRKMN